MISWGCFEIAMPKFLKNCQKNRYGGVPFRVLPTKSTAYNQTVLQVHSGSVEKGKDILKFRNIHKHLCETVPFF